jgi:hypothetical protein
MAYLQSVSMGGAAADATGHIDFAAKLCTFLTGLSAPPTDVIATGGTRLRYVRALAGAIAETWTVTFTSGTTWTVSGSVSGPQANAATGVAYSNGQIAFVMMNINGLPVNGDQFTVTLAPSLLSAAGQSWELYLYQPSNAAYRLRGLGSSSTDQIYCNFSIYTDAPSETRNLKLWGAKGFLEPTPYAISSIDPSTDRGFCLWDAAIPYTFIANSRRFMAVAQVSSVWESLYMGYILPTGTPSEYPYPLAIGGSHRSATRPFRDNQVDGSNGSYHRAFWNPHEALDVLRKSGLWTPFKNYAYNSSEYEYDEHRVMPFAELVMNTAIDGSYVLYPLTLASDNPREVLGDLQGVFMVSGYGSNAAGNIINADGYNHLVVNNTFRVALTEFAAFRLE